jgi:hypothetical protein
MLSWRNPPVIEPEMAGRLAERRVDGRISDDELTHTLSSRGERADAQAIRPDVFTVSCFVIAMFGISKEMIQNPEQTNSVPVIRLSQMRTNSEIDGKSSPQVWPQP